MASLPRPAAADIGAIALLAAAYAVLGWLAHLPGLAASSLHAALVWPAAGVALGALLLRGRQVWPGVWLGAVLANVPSLTEVLPAGSALAIGVTIATGATLQALLGHALARHALGRRFALDAPGPILRFLLLCGPLASLVSASIGVAALSATRTPSVEALLLDWLSWWSGDTIGVMLVTPAVLAVGARPREIWRARRLNVGIPALFAVVFVALGFALVARLEHVNRLAEFEREAELAGNALQGELSRAAEASAAMGEVLLASGNVDRRKFGAMVAGMRDRHPAILALAQAPRVRAADLAAHEKATRAEGFPRYAVFERGAGGARTAAAARDAHYPIHLVYPMTGNDAVLGFDLASTPRYRDVLDRARRNRGVAVSERVPLGWAGTSGYGVLMAVPLAGGGADDAPAGYALTLIQLDRLLDGALRALPTADAGYRLDDLSADGPARQLHAGGESGAATPYVYQRDFAFGDRAWRLVATAGVGHQFAHHAWYSWAMLAGGVLGSGLLMVFLLMMSGRSARTEQLVAERTADLERARAQADRSSQLLREAVTSIAQGFTIYDEHDRLVVCNEAYKSFYEASRDLIQPGATFEDIVRRGAERGQYSEAIGRIDEWVAHRVRQHQSADGQVIEQRLGDGRWLLIVEHRTPSGYIVGNRIDITALKTTEAALADRNAQLDILFQLIPDGLVMFDGKGLARFANQAFLRMTGLLAGEILGHPLAALEARLRGQAEDAARWSGLDACFVAADVGAGGTADPRDGKRHLLALRRPREAVLELLGVSSAAASVSRLLYARDVTHEVEVDRMKSEFLSHAAHELRTPMASIFGFTELLMHQEFDEATRKDLLATIHKQTAWLVDIINELLDLARIESRRGKDFNIEALALVPLVREVAEATGTDPARWPLTVRCGDELPAVRADAAKLRQALTNVLGNARKYSPRGGAIEVDCRARERNGVPFVGVRVTDHGIGMTPEQVSRVGERFYRADTSGNIPGTGLGMTIVKEILELHGGRLEVASQAGQGTTVDLWLPAAVDTAQRRTPDSIPELENAT